MGYITPRAGRNQKGYISRTIDVSPHGEESKQATQFLPLLVLLFNSTLRQTTNLLKLALKKTANMCCFACLLHIHDTLLIRPICGENGPSRDDTPILLPLASPTPRRLLQAMDHKLVPVSCHNLYRWAHITQKKPPWIGASQKVRQAGQSGICFPSNKYFPVVCRSHKPEIQQPLCSRWHPRLGMGDGREMTPRTPPPQGIAPKKANSFSSTQCKDECKKHTCGGLFNCKRTASGKRAGSGHSARKTPTSSLDMIDTHCSYSVSTGYQHGPPIIPRQ